MVLGRPPLSANELAGIRTWILEGALRTVAPPVPPTILEVTSVDSARLEVLFSEEVSESTAENAVNYHILEEVAILSVALVSGNRVMLTTDLQLPGVTYTLVVSGVSDLTGVFIAAGEGDPASFRYTPEISLEDQIQPIFTLAERL